MPPLYDALIRLELKPQEEFEFNKETDSLMRVRGRGVRKLVARRFWVGNRRIHVSMIPNNDGVVETALVSLADGIKRPGFWHVILDASGRPVAEHPLTWTSEKVERSEAPHHPPSGDQAEESIVETTGELARLLVSWLIGYDRVNDDDSAKLLEILGAHLESPRDIRITITERRLAQRFHDEVLCFEDDANGIPNASDQASALRERIALLLKSLPV